MAKVLTVGVFDILHRGHVELFRRAKALGDYLIVAVQDSHFVSKWKPESSTVESTEDRCYMVGAVRYVDEVVVYTDVADIVRLVEFDIFVKGPDQSHDGFRSAVKWCEENGKKVVVLSRTEGISSSDLKKDIKSR